MQSTSINLPSDLKQRIEVGARLLGKKPSAYMRELLEKGLAAEEPGGLKRVYAGLNELRGIGDPGITDASKTIGKELYGANGAWKGTPPSNSNG
jgi:predicted DNA-binding protein